MTKRRVHVYYEGMVQGIGFRYTVENIARLLGGVSGWVMNLLDGRVELVGEGDEKALKDFLEKVRNGFLKRYIRSERVAWQEPTGEFKSFGIKHG